MTTSPSAVLLVLSALVLSAPAMAQDETVGIIVALLDGVSVGADVDVGSGGVGADVGVSEPGGLGADVGVDAGPGGVGVDADVGVPGADVDVDVGPGGVGVDADVDAGPGDDGPGRGGGPDTGPGPPASTPPGTAAPSPRPLAPDPAQLLLDRVGLEGIRERVRRAPPAARAALAAQCEDVLATPQRYTEAAAIICAVVESEVGRGDR